MSADQIYGSDYYNSEPIADDQNYYVDDSGQSRLYLYVFIFKFEDSLKIKKFFNEFKDRKPKLP